MILKSPERVHACIASECGKHDGNPRLGPLELEWRLLVGRGYAEMTETVLSSRRGLPNDWCRGSSGTPTLRIVG